MNIYSSISKNKWKSWVIILLFIIFATSIAYVIGRATDNGMGYVYLAMPIALVYSFISFFFSDKLVLATSRAKEIKKSDNPKLYRIVENLCIAEGLPMPKIHIINDAAPNAFATGRDPKHASVAATTGLLERLSDVELEGVMAHEISHIKNFDIRLLAITAVLVGFIAIITDIFMRSLFWGGVNRDRDSRGSAFFLIVGVILAIIAPIIASLIQLAVSRKREFLADASGALITRYPEGLASALEKIASDPKPLRSATNGTAHLFISNPFKDKKAKSFFTGLFNTHPPMEERVRILREM